MAQANSTAYPTFLLYGRDSKLINKWIGYHENEILQAIDNALKQ